MNKNLFIPLSIILAIFFLSITLLLVANNPRQTLAAPSLTSWYVNAATGDDANDCLTSGTACRTVVEAADRAVDADTIQIAAGVYTGALDISKELVLLGAGHDSTFLDGENSRRVLQASSLAGLTLIDLAVRNGYVSGENGGGIYNFQSLTLDNVRVYSNTTDGSAGGIFNNGSLILMNSEVVSNTSEGVGGGIYSYYSGIITGTDSLIAGNTGNQGGGVYSLGFLHLERVTLRDNFAALFGGGLTIFAGTTELEAVTVSGNETPGYGGGIVNNLGVLTITNSTVSENLANTYSGLANISNLAQTAIFNSTIANNFVSGPGVRYGGVGNISDAIIQFKNTIVADNEGRNCLVSGSWTSGGHNLSSDNYCDFFAPGDLMNTDPQLTALGSYGGSTLTHALLPGSPAIDGGDNSGCPAEDQRGVARPVDGDNDGAATCDIGAVEARNQLTISDSVLVEGDAGTNEAVFIVSLSPSSTQTVMTDYTTADGTALAGSDYITASGTLSFSPGQATQAITVSVTGDTDDEPDEFFNVLLSSPVNADLLDAQGLGTIIDDDGLPSLTIADVAVDEGNTSTVEAVFIVTLSPSATQVVTVSYSTFDDSAVAGTDYTAASGILSYLPGETTKMIPVQVFGDLVDEGISESFTVMMASASNANITDGTGVGTIMDDDIARVSLGAPITIPEGDSGFTPAVFTVTLDAPTAFPVTVDYATFSGVGGSFATPGLDYIEISGSLSYSAGVTEQIVTVQVIGDLEVEGDEHFGIQLSNAQPIAVYINSSTANIRDDESKLYLPVVVR
jgi:hypothetical protein